MAKKKTHDSAFYLLGCNLKISVATTKNPIPWFFLIFFYLIIFIIINFFCSSSAESAASSTALLQVAKFLDQILSICNRLELSILWYMVHNMPYKDATAVIV